jgi:type IV pilus assembly protein PilW
VREGLRGYQGTTTPPVDCIAATDYASQSDMIAIRRIDPDTFTAAEDIAKRENSNRNYVRARVGLDGYLYQGSQFSQADQHILNGNGVLNYEYDFQLLFLRPCSLKENGSCGAHNSTPTLVSLQLQSDGELSQIALVQNVEQMKFEYGVDTDNDQIIDNYQKADHVSEWDKVLSVRANIIVRGDALDHFKDRQIYPMGTDFCHGPATSSCQSKYSGYEGYQRRLVTKDILIRNRVRR